MIKTSCRLVLGVWLSLSLFPAGRAMADPAQHAADGPATQPVVALPADDGAVPDASDHQNAPGAPAPEGAVGEGDEKMPSAVAKGLRRLGQLQDSKPLTGQSDYALWYARRHEPFRLKAETGHYICAVLGPDHGLDNVEATVTLKLRPTDGRRSRWAKMFAVGFVDLDNPKPEQVIGDGKPGGFLGVAAFAGKDARLEVYHAAGSLAMRLPSPLPFDGSTEATICLVHCGGGNEVLIDGKHLAYMPDVSPRPRRIGLYLKVVGMDARIQRVRFDRLAEKDDAP